MQVREVRWSDFDDLREIYFRLYDERAEGYPIGITLFQERPSLTDEVEWFTRMYRRVLDGDQITSVAEIDGHVVGSCSIGRVGALPSAENGHVGLLGILVGKAHRGQGVGSALLRHAIDRARGKFTVIRLSVFSINEGAQRLYRRVGFVPCGHVPREVLRDGQYYDSEEMVLVLDGPAPPGRRE